MRYIVYSKNQSPLCAQHTPKYFLENQKREAKDYAKKEGTIVIDMFKPGTYTGDRWG